MKEKVWSIKLPKGAKYRDIIIGDDNTIKILYSEETEYEIKKKTTDIKEDEKPNTKSIISKPKPLIGGSEVYKIDNVPYWYCKIGNNVFMYVYMEDLTEYDLLYDKRTGKKRFFKSDKEKKFKTNVMNALANKPKEGFRWIPIYEPSLSTKRTLQFIEGGKTLIGLKCNEWEKLIKEYLPQNESEGFSITTYFLLLLRWIKDDVVSLEQLLEHSEKIGHYLDTKDAKYRFEKTGERCFGGLYGFVGNTSKIVKNPNSDSGYSIIGGNCFTYSKEGSVTDVTDIESYNQKLYGSVFLCELKR